MNKARREQLSKLCERLNDIQGEIESIKDEEQEAFDNMPESLQQTERGETSEAAIESMDNGLDRLNDAIEAIEGVVSDLEEAQN